MRLGDFNYRLRLEVQFTKRELELLMLMSKNHYDSECRAASYSKHVMGSEGFLMSAVMSGRQQLWTFAEFDLSAKILEQKHLPPYVDSLAVAQELTTRMNQAMSALSEEFTRLNKKGDNAKG